MQNFCRPSGARYLVGSTLAPMGKIQYPVDFVVVGVKSTRTIVDQVFSVTKLLRLARMSEKSYELQCKMFAAILEKKFMGYASGNFSDLKDTNREDQLRWIIMQTTRLMMEVEPLLEASGKRNWRSIMLTHDEFPCHCLLQAWWYSGRINLVLI